VGRLVGSGVLPFFFVLDHPEAPSGTLDHRRDADAEIATPLARLRLLAAPRVVVDHLERALQRLAERAAVVQVPRGRLEREL
jgi:hypothetical protein